MQSYLGMKTVVDSKAESALKKLQAESEDIGRNENTAIAIYPTGFLKYDRNSRLKTAYIIITSVKHQQ